VPSDDCPMMRLRSPIVTGPSIRVYGPISVPAPMVTPGPMRAYGPTTTSEARVASLLTIAVGWISGIFLYSGLSISTLSSSASATSFPSTVAVP